MSTAPEWLLKVASELPGGDAIVAVTRVDGGEVNETFRVLTASEELFVVRRAPEQVADWHPTTSGQVAAIELARLAGVPVPEIVYVSGRVIAYRFVAGEPLAVPARDRGLVRRAGRVYGLLHQIEGDGVGPVQADGASAGWPATIVFQDVAKWAERLLALETGPIPKSLIAAAAEVLAKGDVDETSRLVHGDASPSNTIVAGSQVVAIIDFDDAWFGDPAGDMAWWWWNDPATGDDFAAGCADAGGRHPEHLWRYRLRLLLGLADSFATTHPTRAAKIAHLLPIALRGAKDESVGSI